MALYEACSGPQVTGLVPLDGSVGVSPDAVMYMVADTECGTGVIQVTLTADGSASQTLDVDVIETGLYKLDGLVLEPNRAHTLEAGQAWVGFETGDGPVQALDGLPELQITGSQLTHKQATVSLQVTPADDPFGAPFTLSRDGDVIAAGVDAQAVVDDFSSKNHAEWCYTMNQYLGDGSSLSADEACVTLAHAGCSAVGATPSTIGLLVGLGAVAATFVTSRRRTA
jgi:hypothetical protein